MRECVAEREHPLRRPSGAQQGRQRPAPIACLVPVVSQLGGHRRIDVEAGVDRFDRCGDRGMQRQPLAWQQLLVGGFPEEAVAELHDLVVARQQQVAVDRLPQRGSHLGLLHVGDDRQDVVSRGLTGDGDDAQQVSRRGRQAADSGQQRLSKGQTHALLAALLHGEQLLGEEGVAPAALVQASDEGAVGRVAEDARELVVNLGARERGELDALDLPAAPQLGEQGEKRMALVQLVGAIGPDQHHAAAGEISHQEPEHVAGRSIRPVQVLERDDGGRVRGDALDQPEHLEVEGGLARRGGRFGRSLALAAGLEVGDQLQYGGSCRPDDAVEVLRAAGPSATDEAQRRVGRTGGAPSPRSTHAPARKRSPADSAPARSSASNRVLPTPASPPTMTVPTDPDLAPSSTACSRWSSSPRPTNTGLEIRAVIRRLSALGE